MNPPSDWLGQFFTIGSAACEGVLQARAAKREARQAARNETAVPPRWRVDPQADDAPHVAPPQASPAEPPRPSPPPTVVPLILPPVVAPWERPARARASARAASSSAPAAISDAAPSNTTPKAFTVRESPVPSSPAPHAVEPIPAAAVPTAPSRPPESSSATARPAPSPTATSTLEEQAPTRQLDLDFTPKPSSIPAPTEPTAQATSLNNDAAALTAETAGRFAAMLGHVIGDIVGDTVESVLEHQESRFIQLLEHQDARFQQLLAHQARSHADDLARVVEMSAENLRVVLREVFDARSPAPVEAPVQGLIAASTALTEAVEGLQETLRRGCGEIRASLNQHHNELMTIVRAEIRPLAQAALARLNLDPVPPLGRSQQATATTGEAIGRTPVPDSSGAGSPAPGTSAAPSPRPSPPDRAHEHLTPVQRRRVHLAIADEDVTDTEDDETRPTLRYRPPDDTHPQAPEASP